LFYISASGAVRKGAIKITDRLKEGRKGVRLRG
jgi:hypothetical protein